MPPSDGGAEVVAQDPPGGAEVRQRCREESRGAHDHPQAAPSSTVGRAAGSPRQWLDVDCIRQELLALFRRAMKISRKLHNGRVKNVCSNSNFVMTKFLLILPS